VALRKKTFGDPCPKAFCTLVLDTVLAIRRSEKAVPETSGVVLPELRSTPTTGK